MLQRFYLQLDFATSSSGVVLVITVKVFMLPHQALSLLSNQPESFVALLVQCDFVRAVNLVVGKHACLESKPSRPPSFPIVHPLVEESGSIVTHSCHLRSLDLALHNLKKLSGEIRGGLHRVSFR